MRKLASALVSALVVVSLFGAGFSGSRPTSAPSEAARPTAASPVSPDISRGSGGGSSFWWLQPVIPAQSEVAPAASCRPVVRSGPPCAEPAPGERVGRMAGVEQWRPLVERHFRAEDVDLALRIILCESNGNPRAANPTSTARGLFQHLGSMWAARAASAGRPGADIFDPDDNVAVAAWLVYHGGGWSHWNPSRHCW